MPQLIWIVCSAGEEALAEQIAAPLREAGYRVGHDGTVGIGESRVSTVTDALHQGVPVVLCATPKAVGSTWSQRVVAAAQDSPAPRVFLVKMTEDTLLTHLNLGDKWADYAAQPDTAIRDLLAALSKHYPPVRLVRPTEPYTRGQKASDDRGIELSMGFQIQFDAVKRFRDNLRADALAYFPATLTDREFLARAGLVQSDGAVSSAARILFGSDDGSSGFHCAVVQCIKYDGRDRAAIRESRVVHQGPVLDQIQGAYDFVLSASVLGEYPDAASGKTQPRYKFPPIAVREIIVNALAHRDYERGDSVTHVRIFADRLEVTSPGIWASGSIPDNAVQSLGSLEGQSVKRNLRLAQALSWVSFVEGEGSGIPTAVRNCLDNRAPTPTIVQRDGWVTVTIRPASSNQPKHKLNPRFIFDAFVIGGSNRFAQAAALAVAENPGKAYNPLTIYGDSGLGKTHLLHAVGDYVRSQSADARVQYITTEEFTGDFISSITQNKTVEFRRRYREIDVLLIDDIQFLEGKEQTQEEFFHTFNTLHNDQKQIVMTSDRPPRLLENLEPRLRSRFSQGLIADIQPPDLETRIAILRKKAAQERLSAGPDVLEFIASRIQTNIRELEGALIRVTAFASLNRQQVDLNLAEIVLKDLIPEGGEAQITSTAIMAQTAAYFGLTIDDLCGQSRTHVLVTARQIAMYLCRELTDLSLNKIGQQFGGRDATTVTHADRKIRTLMAERRSVFNQVTELTNRIQEASQH